MDIVGAMAEIETRRTNGATVIDAATLGTSQDIDLQWSGILAAIDELRLRAPRIAANDTSPSALRRVS